MRNPWANPEAAFRPTPPEETLEQEFHRLIAERDSLRREHMELDGHASGIRAKALASRHGAPFSQTGEERALLAALGDLERRLDVLQERIAAPRFARFLNPPEQVMRDGKLIHA